MATIARRPAWQPRAHPARPSGARNRSRGARLLGALCGSRGIFWQGVAAAVALGASAVVSLLVVPADAAQGDVQRLMYVHVPAAWTAYLSFAVVAFASAAYLRTGRVHWDRLAVAAAEAGVLFTGLTIALGSLWGRPIWGAWWTWDPRLTTTLVLLLVYAGYLAVRGLPDNPDRGARWSAVVGLVGFLDVPVVHLSVVWWRGLHQPATVLRPGTPTMAGSMLAALLLAVLAFTLLWAYLVAARMRTERAAQRTRRELLSAPVRRGVQPVAPVADLVATAPTPQGAGSHG
jgi:heme exporter protein C